MRELAQAIVAHYLSVRRDLPWRRTRDPYAIWVSEVMLQQTRVATVIPYWERWMARFPTVSALAEAPLDDVLAAWAGLGYYARARSLATGAKEIALRWKGKLPARASELREVKGIGPYTAGAIASIAHGERTPLVDGNVARVLSRVFAIEHDIKTAAGTKALWKAAGELMAALPETVAPGDLNQGLMELGATLCSPTSPRCPSCPLAKRCIANRDKRTAELPVIAPRKKQAELAVLARTQVWIESDDRIVLARRSPAGLFGGLWELPDRELAERLGARVDAEPVAHHDQVLSHRRLRVTVVRGQLDRGAPLDSAAGNPGYDAVTRVAISKVATLGVAAASTAIVAKYQDTPWTSTPKRSSSSPRATPRSSKASASSVTTSATKTSPKQPSGRRKASTSSSTTRGKSRRR